MAPPLSYPLWRLPYAGPCLCAWSQYPQGGNPSFFFQHVVLRSFLMYSGPPPHPAPHLSLYKLMSSFLVLAFCGCCWRHIAGSPTGDLTRCINISLFYIVLKYPCSHRGFIPFVFFPNSSLATSQWKSMHFTPALPHLCGRDSYFSFRPLDEHWVIDVCTFELSASPNTLTPSE